MPGHLGSGFRPACQAGSGRLALGAEMRPPGPPPLTRRLEGVADLALHSHVVQEADGQLAVAHLGEWEAAALGRRADRR